MERSVFRLQKTRQMRTSALHVFFFRAIAFTYSIRHGERSEAIQAAVRIATALRASQ
jgi:hypothetical protein